MVTVSSYSSNIKIDVVRVLVRTSTGNVLAIKSGTDPDKWVLPGGELEKSDLDLKSTLTRLLLEETGYICNKDKLIQCNKVINFQQHEAVKDLKHLLLFILPSDYLRSIADIKLNEGEFRWIPFEEFKENEQYPFTGEFVEKLLSVNNHKDAIHPLRRIIGGPGSPHNRGEDVYLNDVFEIINIEDFLVPRDDDFDDFSYFPKLDEKSIQIIKEFNPHYGVWMGEDSYWQGVATANNTTFDKPHEELHSIPKEDRWDYYFSIQKYENHLFINTGEPGGDQSFALFKNFRDAFNYVTTFD